MISNGLNEPIINLAAPAQRIVIVTGMHRSGTSLVAGVIQKAGVNLGDRFIETDRGNPRGYFEAVDFNNFQAKILNRLGQSFLVQNIAAIGAITPQETEEALALIKQRSTHELWGWKDPRTSLFLDFWHNLLPEARYVFVYRHPIDVALSLLKRNIEHDLEVLANPLTAVRAWQVYNEFILNFYAQHQAECLLCHISGVAADIDSFLDLTARKFEVPLKSEGTRQLYHADELTQSVFPMDATDTLRLLAPEAMEIYERLEAQADLPGRLPNRPDTSSTRKLSELKSISSKLRQSGKPDEAQLGNLFARLLTALDPQVVLVAKDALDGIRTKQIGDLETLVINQQKQIHSLTEHTHNLEQMSEETAQRVRDLTEYSEQKERLIRDLIAASALQQQTIQALNIQVGERAQTIQALTAQAADQAQSIQALNAKAVERARIIQAQNEQAVERAQTIQALTTKTVERAQSIQALNAQVGEQAQTIQALNAQVGEQAQTIQALNAQVGEQAQTIPVLNAQVDKQAQTIQVLDAQVDKQVQTIQVLNARLGEQAQAARALQTQLALVLNSPGWQLMQPLRLMRLILTPPGSLRELITTRLIAALLRVALAPRFLLRQRNNAGNAAAASGQLVFGNESDLAKPFPVGKGNVYRLTGWCYHSQSHIRHLHVLVDGVPHRVFHHSMARPDVMHALAVQVDTVGHSLMSGFWVLLPFQEIRLPRQVHLAFQAELDNGEISQADIGVLELIPSVERTSELVVIDKAVLVDEPLIAICMTSYNPPLDLFVKQINSIIRQSYQHWFCIVTDDCSTQDVYEEIQAILAQDKRFHLRRNVSRLGAYHNFEQCLAMVPVEADFIALSDHDDEWYPDKLATLLSSFDADTLLVYSDMDIVRRDGELISHSYWVTRSNNYTDLESLLFANTVTGAASMFRSSLLADLLPFPQRLGGEFHDHWIACAALAKGAIEYVDRPLYAYYQHAGNVIGHYTHEPYGWLPKLSIGTAQGTHAAGRLRAGVAIAIWWLRSPSEFTNQLAPSVETLNSLYYGYFIQLVLLAKTLSVRLRDVAGKQRSILDQFAGFESSMVGPIVQAFKYQLFRRPTLGLERYCLQLIMGQLTYSGYYRWNKQRFFQQQALASQPIMAVAEPAPKLAPVDANWPVDFIPAKVAPLNLSVSPSHPRRINIIIGTIDFRYLFAGYVSIMHLALRLSRAGYKVRLVIVDPCEFDPTSWRRELVAYPGLGQLIDSVEFAYVYDRSVVLEANPQDGFMATSWWTAHIAHHAVNDLGREKFVFMEQEYEPMFYPAGALYAMAQEAYTLPQYTLFSTEFLWEYFRQNRLGVFSSGDVSGLENSTFFRNATYSFKVSEQALAQRKHKKLLFYARPESHAARNMFELGVLALREVVRDGCFDLNKWEFHGIGSTGNFTNLKLDQRVNLKLFPRVSLAEYLDLLPSYDLGLSLMLTPHPSMTPLDMAAAGLVTVTNTYANKTQDALSRISTNIIAVPPTIDGIKAGLIRAVAKTDDFRARAAGSKLDWSTDWNDAFNESLMLKLGKFIDSPT